MCDDFKMRPSSAPIIHDVPGEAARVIDGYLERKTGAAAATRARARRWHAQQAEFDREDSKA